MPNVLTSMLTGPRSREIRISSRCRAWEACPPQKVPTTRCALDSPASWHAQASKATAANAAFAGEFRHREARSDRIDLP